MTRRFVKHLLATAFVGALAAGAATAASAAPVAPLAPQHPAAAPVNGLVQQAHWVWHGHHKVWVPDHRRPPPRHY